MYRVGHEYYKSKYPIITPINNKTLESGPLFSPMMHDELIKRMSSSGTSRFILPGKFQNF